MNTWTNKCSLTSTWELLLMLKLNLLSVEIVKYIINSRRSRLLSVNPTMSFCGGYSTWIAVDVHFRGAGRRPGKDALVQRFGSCGVLGLFNAGALCLPHLLPKSQLHREDLEQWHPEAETLPGSHYIFYKHPSGSHIVGTVCSAWPIFGREKRSNKHVISQHQSKLNLLIHFRS